MTERELLLAAILAHLDDDTPRLVYADWLQEHGEDERAEFIRRQCRGDAVVATELFAHVGALGFADVTFRRGFVDAVTSGILHFRDHAAALAPADAPAFALKLVDDSDDDYDAHIQAAFDLAARPELRRCVSLDLPCMGLDASSYLLESEHLIGVRRLNFPNNEAGSNIESVASPTFANLRWANFNYSNSADGRPSITPFAECPHLVNLEYLDFGSNAMWDGELRALADSSHLPSLRYLNVSSSSFGPDSLEHFFGTRSLPALTELDLSCSFDSFGDAEPRDANRYAEWIARSPLLARLSKLWLRGNGITDDGAKALASAPPSVKLEVLDLTGNPISGDGQRLLRERFGEGVCVFDGGARD